MFLPGGFHEDVLLAHHSSFFFFSGGTNSSFWCWSYPLTRFKCFLMPVHLLIIHFSLFNCSGVLKISRRFVFPLYICSSSFEDVILFNPFKFNRCNLSSRSFNGVSFEWALTHRSFPGSYLTLLIFSKILIFFSKLDIRMNYHQSYVFLQDLSNSFHCWLNLFHSSFQSV